MIFFASGDLDSRHANLPTNTQTRLEHSSRWFTSGRFDSRPVILSTDTDPFCWLWVVIIFFCDTFLIILLHIASRMPVFYILCKFGTDQFTPHVWNWVRTYVLCTGQVSEWSTLSRQNFVPWLGFDNIAAHCLAHACVLYSVQIWCLSIHTSRLEMS